MIQNPWKGLAPYREPKDTDESSYLFCGRDKAARESERPPFWKPAYFPCSDLPDTFPCPSA